MANLSHLPMFGSPVSGKALPRPGRLPTHGQPAPGAAAQGGSQATSTRLGSARCQCWVNQGLQGYVTREKSIVYLATW